MKHFIEGERIYFDTETTGLYPRHGDVPFAWSFANENLDVVYFEFQVEPFTRALVRDTFHRENIAKIRRLLEDRTIIKGGHNIKFDIGMAEYAEGMEVCGPGGKVNNGGGDFEETMFMAWVCNSLEPDLKLKNLAMRYADISNADEKILKKVVNRARLRVRKYGWKIAYKETMLPDGSVKREAQTAADYWVPRMAHLLLGSDVITAEEAGACKEYGSQDAVRTAMLAMFYRELMQEMGVLHTYNFEKQLWPTVYGMERRGVRIDPERNAREIADMKRRAAGHLAKLCEVSGKPDFNPDADNQVRWLLFDKLGLPINPKRLTEKTQQPSVNVDAMTELRTVHPVVESIVRYRGSVKAYGYFNSYRTHALPDPLAPQFKVLYPEFRQLKAATGRFSCANPNLQQVTSAESSRSEDPIDARHAFGPRPGYIWLLCDYSGMEVRVYADVAKEPNMLRAIAEDRDIHDEFANMLWGGEGNSAGIRECVNVLGLNGSEHANNPTVQAVWKRWNLSMDDIALLSSQNRNAFASEWLASFGWDIIKAQGSIDKKVTKNKGKMCTFNKIYGGGVNAIMNLLKCDRSEAYEILDAYGQRIPRMNEYAAELEAEARANGCIWTLWNRRLAVRPEYLYQCVNYIVQGSSADLLKSVMIKISRWFKEENIDAHIVITLHDELVIEVARYEATPAFVIKVCELMEDTEGHIDVPMPVKPAIATDCWTDKVKIKLKGRAA